MTTMQMQQDEDCDYDDDGGVCQTCHGEGYLEANEAHCDWINYGDDLVRCPNCNGSGDAKDQWFW
jgi:DnaJ-class molecular chaperone